MKDGHKTSSSANAGRNALTTNGEGTFTTSPSARVTRNPKNVLSVGAAWFDYDNDGLLRSHRYQLHLVDPQSDKQCSWTRRTKSIAPNRLQERASGSTETSAMAASRCDRSKAASAKRSARGMGIPSGLHGDELMDVFIANDTGGPIFSSSTRATNFQGNGLDSACL